MSVLPPDARLLKKHSWLFVLIGFLIVLLLVAWTVYDKLFREHVQMDESLMVPRAFQPGTVEAFKYASIGVEDEGGIPYWIWLVLPRVFPEHLPGPGGYSSLGLVWEPGHETPVGFSKKRIGYDRVAINCAACHSATFRTLRDDGRTTTTQVVAAGPSNRFDPQRYLAFLSSCASDPRFNADTLLDAIAYNVKLSWLDQKLYRHLLIPGTRKAILQQRESNSWQTGKPLWGHGRIDPFNPVKFGMLEMEHDDTVGNSDMMPLWELDKRKRGNQWDLHWDGLVTDPRDASLAGALGDGATRKSLPVKEIDAMVTFLKNYRPTRLHNKETEHPDDQMVYPLGWDEDLAERGRGVFTVHCANCHGPEGTYTNAIIPAGDELPDPDSNSPKIGTDDHRIKMWNPFVLKDPKNPDDNRHSATRYNNFGDKYDWDLNSFVGTDGYASVPLNGIWLRAPYLHNGSVPTLEDLLNPPLSVEELSEMIEKLNLKVKVSGGTPVDYQALVDRFNQVPVSNAPATNVASRLKQLGRFVDLSIKYARLKRRRPAMFYRGYDVVDRKLVGFIHTSDAVKDRPSPIPYITSVKGNSNQGHLWGTNLEADEKHALIEYLKTL